MAKETRSKYVFPDMEAYTIQEWEGFGWEVLSSQRTKNDAGDTIIKLTFNRDKEMANYAQLNSKFELYLKKEDEMKEIAKRQENMERPRKKKFKMPIILGLCFFGIPLIVYSIKLASTNKKVEKALVEYNKEYRKLQERFDQLNEECEQILNEAKALL